MEIRFSREWRCAGALNVIYIFVFMSRLSPYSASCRGLAASAPCMQGCENVRERALYASNVPLPPSQLEGRNIGGLTRRMRRIGRLSPKQYRDLTGRRVFTLSSGGFSPCRNHVEQVEHVDYVNSWSSELELESGIGKKSFLELESRTRT